MIIPQISYCKIVIPAREGSKGFPHKNRKLFKYTIDSIPEEYRRNIIVTTDDTEIIKWCVEYGVTFQQRDKKYASDTSSIKEVLMNLKKDGYIDNHDVVILLYLTYPQRNWNDILQTLKFFINTGSRSLLCKKEINGVHPYLCLLDHHNYYGRQLKRHNLYRRQDYPKMFEISHFISIFNVKELKKLNDNIYNKNTIFYPIGNKLDVDYELTLKEFMNEKEKNL